MKMGSSLVYKYAAAGRKGGAFCSSDGLLLEQRQPIHNRYGGFLTLQRLY
jgi:hypothetical protein